MTLIELLAAITILSIIIIPVFQLLNSAYTNYMYDQRKVKALTIAQNHIEALKADMQESLSLSTKTELQTLLHNLSKDSYTKVYDTEQNNYRVEILFKRSPSVGIKKIAVKLSVFYLDSHQPITFINTEIKDPI